MGKHPIFKNMIAGVFFRWLVYLFIFRRLQRLISGSPNQTLQLEKEAASLNVSLIGQPASYTTTPIFCSHVCCFLKHCNLLVHSPHPINSAAPPTANECVWGGGGWVWMPYVTHLENLGVCIFVCIFGTYLAAKAGWNPSWLWNPGLVDILLQESWIKASLSWRFQ